MTEATDATPTDTQTNATHSAGQCVKATRHDANFSDQKRNIRDGPAKRTVWNCSAATAFDELEPPICCGCLASARVTKLCAKLSTGCSDSESDEPQAARSTGV